MEQHILCQDQRAIHLLGTRCVRVGADGISRVSEDNLYSAGVINGEGETNPTILV